MILAGMCLVFCTELMVLLALLVHILVLVVVMMCSSTFVPGVYS